MELLLEPSENPAAKVFKQALMEQGIPYTAFFVDDLKAEYERMCGLGVRFTMPPAVMGPTMVAVFDDTCGNLIALNQIMATPAA